MKIPTTLVAITCQDEVQPMILWGARFAKAKSSHLVILCWIEGQESQPEVQVSLENWHEKIL